MTHTDNFRSNEGFSNIGRSTSVKLRKQRASEEPSLIKPDQPSIKCMDTSSGLPRELTDRPTEAQDDTDGYNGKASYADLIEHDIADDNGTRTCDSTTRVHRRLFNILITFIFEWSTWLLSRYLLVIAWVLTQSRNMGGPFPRQANEARIFLLQRAVRLAPLGTSFKQNLAISFEDRFEEVGQEADLDKAISLYRESLRIRPTPPRYMNNLGNALRKKACTKAGLESTLDEAISLLQKAHDLQPSRHVYMVNLAIAMSVRYGQGGLGLRRYQESDFDESVSLFQRALESREALPSSDQWWCLHELALSFQGRFMLEDEAADLDKAISLHSEVLETCPQSVKVVCIIELADCLYLRAEERIGGVEDLDEAISLYRLASTMAHPPVFELNETQEKLGHALQMRYQKTGNESDLAESISLLRRVLDLRPSSHPRRSSALGTLASALSVRFKSHRQGSDIEEVISLCRQALLLQNSENPWRPYTLMKLSESLIYSVELNGKSTDYLEEVLSACLEVMDSTSIAASARLELAYGLSKVLRWAGLGKEKPNIYTGAMMKVYDCMLQLFPQVASLELDVRSRHRALNKIKIPFSRAAASRAATDYYNNPGKVIEILEVGRNIFWSQALSLRPPLRKLQVSAPSLADRLRALSSQIEQGNSFQAHVDRLSANLNYQASNLRRLQEEWKGTIEQIRRIAGFQDFLRQPTFPTLQSVANEYPIVFLFEDPDTLLCVCLIVTPTNVHKILLKRFGFKLPLEDLVRLLQVAVSDSSASRTSVDDRWRRIIDSDEGIDRGMRPRRANDKSPDAILKYVLALLWDTVTKPVIECLGLKKSKSSNIPIVKWCPIGLFSFLPLHAAGLFNGDQMSECAADYFVSSYTPNISILLPSESPRSSAKFKMMAVIQSEGLPATKRELESIRRHAPDGALLELGVPGSAATVETVASQLSEAAIVHFACHGKQNQTRPLESGLTLDDGLLSISRIMKETIPDGSLGFLCACETALGDANLPDEAMSLGASLLFSGFRSVIATMWEIRDEDGPVIADAFYEELFRGTKDNALDSRPDITQSAHALHIAVQELRSKQVSLRRWIPFIHMGK